MSCRNVIPQSLSWRRCTMKCKSCGRDVPDNSIFCNWCGEKLLKERKKKDEIKVPAPRKLPSGSWRIYLDAEKQSITEKTKDLCISKAKAIRAGFIESKKNSPKITCRQAISKMMEEKKGIVSPSTMRNTERFSATHLKNTWTAIFQSLSTGRWRSAARHPLSRQRQFATAGQLFQLQCVLSA